MNIVPQLIINSIIAGAIYSLIALGFNLIYSTTKFFDLSCGVMAAVGGYSVYYLSQLLGLNIYFAIILAVLFSGFVGFGIDKLVYSKLRAKKASTMIMLVASLGVFTLLQAIIAIIFSSQYRTLAVNITKQNIYNIFSGVATQTQFIILFSAIIIMLGLVLILNKTKFGKAVKAIGDDEEVSKVVGINTSKIISYVFFIGSAIIGYAGILIGFDTGIEPTMGLVLLLKGVIAAIVGGIGSIYGGVLGAFMLGFVENFGIWKISGEWKDAIAFGLLILFLLFRPQGILKK